MKLHSLHSSHHNHHCIMEDVAGPVIIWKAIEDGNTAALRAILKEGDNGTAEWTGMENESEETPLMFASRMGKTECVIIMLEHLACSACEVCKERLLSSVHGEDNELDDGRDGRERRHDGCSASFVEEGGSVSCGTRQRRSERNRSGMPSENRSTSAQDSRVVNLSRKRSHRTAFGENETCKNLFKSRNSPCDVVFEEFLNHKNSCDTTALMLAAGEGFDQVVRVLLRTGSDLHCCSEEGYTALDVAALEGHRDVVLVFLESPACVLEPQERLAAFMNACEGGHAHVARLLLSHGFGMQLSLEDGETALICAAHSGHCEVVKLLLDSGVDPDAVDADGRNALLIAAHSCYYTAETVSFLLDRGFDPNIADTCGDTALLYLGETFCRHWKLRRDLAIRMQKLLNAGANINYRSPEDGSSILIRMAAYPDLERLQICLNAGADVNCQDFQGDTALSKPWQGGSQRLEVTKALVEAGANIHHLNNAGEGALVDALARSDVELVSYLVAKGVSVSQANKEGVTPLLQLVCRRGSDPQLVDVLVKAGAVMTGTELHELFFHADRDDPDVLCMVNALLRNGAAPSSMPVSSLKFQVPTSILEHVSPLAAAAFLGRFNMVTYLTSILFLSPYDVSDFAKDLETDLRFRGGLPLRKDIWDFVSALHSEPRSLFEHSFMAVTAALGAAGPDRLRRIDQLPVPEPLKDKLKFKQGI